MAVSVVGASIEGDVANRGAFFIEHGDGGFCHEGDHGAAGVDGAELDGDPFACVAGADVAVVGYFVPPR